jgi:hypothetical protein
LRQFLLLWQCVDDLQRFESLAKEREQKPLPQTLDEVLAQ